MKLYKPAFVRIYIIYLYIPYYHMGPMDRARKG